MVVLPRAGGTRDENHARTDSWMALVNCFEAPRVEAEHGQVELEGFLCREYA